MLTFGAHATTHHNALALASLLIPLIFWSDFFAPIQALFQGFWSLGSNGYNQWQYFASELEKWFDNAWAWLKAILTWTSRQATALLFTFDQLWNSAIQAGLLAAGDLFRMLDNLMGDVMHPIHNVLEAVIDYALFILINGTVTGLAVIPDFVRAIVAAHPKVIDFAQSIETALFAREQAVADAFSLVKARVNDVVSWLNLFAVVPGRLNVQLLVWSVAEFLPWFTQVFAMWALPPDLQTRLDAVKDQYPSRPAHEAFDDLRAGTTLTSQDRAAIATVIAGTFH